MRIFTALAALLALSVGVVACAADTNDDPSASNDNVDQGTEQDITAAKNQLKGSWTIDKASADESPNVSYVFNANGSFSREVNKVLNGVFLPGSPRPTEHQSGTYTIKTSKHEVTLRITSPRAVTETLSYDYVAGRILNGVFLPGSTPNTEPTLTLTGIAAPGSHVAFPAIKYDQAAATGGGLGATCGGLAGLPCQAGLVCDAPATCCDMAGVCVAK